MKAIMKWKTPLIYSLLALYVLLIAAFYFSYMKSSSKLEDLNKQYEQKEAMVGRVQALVQQKSPESQLTDAERLAGETAIPDLPRVEMLIRAVKQYQAEAGVKVSSLTFGGSAAGADKAQSAQALSATTPSTTGAPIISSDPMVNGLNSVASSLLGDKNSTPQSGLSKVEMNLTLSGKYGAIKQFIDKLQTSQRLITVSSLSLSGSTVIAEISELQTDMAAEMSITAYYLPVASTAPAK